MNDNDLDTMLREHGAAWRADNAHRPGIDWDTVTGTRPGRGWLAIGGAVVAAAAIVAAVVLVLGGGGANNRPTPENTVPPPSVARLGAPKGFFGIAPPDVSGPGGAVAFVIGSGYTSTHPPHQRAVAEGVAPNGRTVYAAFPETGCRTLLQKTEVRPHNTKQLGAGTIAGRVQRTAIAVDPDGVRLAFVVDHAGPGCAPAEELEIYNVSTHQKQVMRISTYRQIQDLAFSPDGRTLLVQVLPQCLHATCVPPLSAIRPGTYALNVGPIIGAAGNTRSIAEGGYMMPPREQAGGDGVFAPVFFWHGQYVTLLNGAIRAVLDVGLGRPLATGFPKDVISVSSDPTGNHLLLTAAPIHDWGLGNGGYSVSSPYSNDTSIAIPQIYRWDQGRLAKVSGSWLQPGW
jgi:hypothetical protein